MNIAVVAALVLASGAADEESAWNCDAPEVQQAMNWCAAQDFSKADAALNAQWGLATAEMKRRDEDFGESWDKRRGYFETLLKSQRAWLSYRDAQCAIEGYTFRGGTMEPLLVATCKTRLTEARTEDLRDMIEVDG